ncbi:MAG: M1 family metallopeptidase, partial [Flavobacteriales bacterium]|nr:M1 family metallopeptidase [Flavobacteriales bacterium]
MANRILQLFFLAFASFSYALGQDYWQQDLSYTINVKLDDQKHRLDADIKIDYTNNSPDELGFIYMHLWPNAYKDRSTALVKQKLENGDADLYYASEEWRGYIDGLAFKVDGQEVKWELDSNNIDICKIFLNSPLPSGGKIEISTPFLVKFPRGIYSRLGHIGESYQVTQWYPKPAVYDKSGWHQMPYLDQGEFYSEFGTYDVFITLPKNYRVGSTGDLVDGEEELKWLDEKVAETEEYVKGISGASSLRPGKEKEIDDLVFPLSAPETKTLHYHQAKVHDFGWFADKRWHVLKGEVELPHSKEMVQTWVMFTDAEAHLWKNGIEYMNDAVYYYSLWNGDYPYEHATAVDGALSAGGGMEYPNVTVIGTSGDAFGLETVIMHEVGHNWFYGILGSNERDHPWMDEGLNSFNENRYVETKYPNQSLMEGQLNGRGKFLGFDAFDHKDRYYLGYLLNARRGYDQPIEFKSHEYSYLNYGTVVYGKTALAFDYLMAYLGNDVMDKAMHKYYDTWKFKHPQPEDLRKILEEETGKNLSWFFDNLINDDPLIDYKIVNAKDEGGDYIVTIKNVTGTKVPFSLSGLKGDSAVTTSWYEGFDKKKQFTVSAGDYDALKIDFLKDIPEVNRRNNTLKTSGLFKKLEPLKLQVLTSFENSDRTQLFWTPVVGWNEYDHFMPGLAFYNSVLPARKFEYLIMPLYSTSSETILGSAKLGHTWYPSSTFQNIGLTAGGSRYSNGNRVLGLNSDSIKMPFDTQANKVKVELAFTLKNANARSKIVNKILLSS